MTKEEHIKIHKELHESLDKLLADFITCTSNHLSSASIMELVEWSHKQTIDPDERSFNNGL